MRLRSPRVERRGEESPDSTGREVLLQWEDAAEQIRGKESATESMPPESGNRFRQG